MLCGRDVRCKSAPIPKVRTASRVVLTFGKVPWDQLLPEPFQNQGPPICMKSEGHMLHLTIMLLSHIHNMILSKSTLMSYTYPLSPNTTLVPSLQCHYFCLLRGTAICLYGTIMGTTSIISTSLSSPILIPLQYHHPQLRCHHL